MKDTYPLNTALPSDCLVAPAQQPDYADVALPDPGAGCNVGDRLADAHVRAGRGALVAAIQAETGKRFTFADLAGESTRLAAGLVTLGVKPGDRVAFQAPNDPEVLIVMIAIWKVGGVVVPIPAYANEAEVQYFIADTGARFLLAHANTGTVADRVTTVAQTALEGVYAFGPGHDDIAVPSWTSLKTDDAVSLPTVDPDQVAILWHTGGTTGHPKGCYHTHRRFLLGGYAFGAGNAVAPGQNWAVTTPVGHALGIIYNTIFTVLHGATAVMIENFSDPKTVLGAVADHKVTTLTGLMASWAKMTDFIRKGADGMPVDTTSLTRCFAMWQAASAADVYDFWLDRGVELLNNFGSTSFANWVLVPPPGEKAPRAALGRSLPGYSPAAVEATEGKVRILPAGEIGQLAVKGPTGLTYWNRPDLQASDVRDGWTLSDDLVRFDADGFAHYLGRTDYMISTGGFKVAPGEVEEALVRHPAVREVAVVPAPCPTRLEKVVAYIALLPDIAENDALRQELKAMVKGQLAFYKTPREIVFVDALPRDAVGKVQTKIVRDWVLRDLSE
ncbi:acyl-CoA synthetase [Actibacterium sp. D379-3]